MTKFGRVSSRYRSKLFSVAYTEMPSPDPAIEAVVEAEHLSEETRRVYSSKLGIIAAAAGN